MSSSSEQLPPTNGSVQVVLLDGGGFTTASDKIIHADGIDTTFYLYNWCFYIHHPDSGRNILWDLGISDNRSLYTPVVLNSQWPACNPVGPRRSLVDQLNDIGVAATDIDTIIFSHAHWDHCRPPGLEFPNAKIIFGPGTRAHCSPGHRQKSHDQGDHPVARRGGDRDDRDDVQWDARFFSDDPRVQTDPFDEAAGPWTTSWGPFDHAMDYLGDGSFCLLQAPGHMPGNLAAAAKIRNGEWVVMGGDCCHSRDILLGRREIANVSLPNGSHFCVHSNLGQAIETIGRLKDAADRFGAHVALAHDPEFIRDGTDEVLMAILHPMFDHDCLARIRRGERV